MLILICKIKQTFLCKRLSGLFLLILLKSILIANSSFANDFRNGFNHGISVFGDLKYDNNFDHFDYANPNALKSGLVRFGVEGSFNNLNKFILKGIPAAGLSYIYDNLTVTSDDEVASRYGLIAKEIKLSENKEYIDFILRKEAIFHDKKPITADDVIFTFNILTSKGHPSYKMSLRDVKNVIKINDHHVRFEFKHNKNRDLPNLVASLPVLPKHYYQKHDFTKTTLKPPLGSGPYKIAKVKANRTISYERVKNYWAKDLPVNKGRYNFNKIIYDYYRDSTILVEAFKAQKYDVRLENVARNWANSYNIEAVKNNQIIKKEIRHKLPAPMQAFIMNLRKPKFENIAIRKALNLAFDFEWLKKHIFYDSYNRTNSFFANTDFSYISTLDKLQIAGSSFLPQKTNADGFNRDKIVEAQNILKEAGYRILQQKLIDPKTNKQVRIEFLNQSQSFLMIIAPYIANLKKLGIDATIRMVEENQYKTRVNNFDYDIIVAVYGQSLIPGNELYAYFHSSQKDIKGSRNLIGIDNKKVDDLVKAISRAQDISELRILCQKLDKILLESYYIIPQWYNNTFRILYRDIFAFPEKRPQYGLAIDSWYLKEPYEKLK